MYNLPEYFFLFESVLCFQSNDLGIHLSEALKKRCHFENYDLLIRMITMELNDTTISTIFKHTALK